ncbi:uncharacterized protein [Temnothorax longispinosus]|uniref:uncharacterized protein n=1 Tax=Temnothorax longispinosus TaxID=300112 RepID=UPI003A9A650C
MDEDESNEYMDTMPANGKDVSLTPAVNDSNNTTLPPIVGNDRKRTSPPSDSDVPNNSVFGICPIHQEGGDPSLHSLNVSRLIAQFAYKDVIEVRKTGRGRVTVDFRCRVAANNLVNNPILKAHNLKAYIPSFKVQRIGIIKDVPKEFATDSLAEYIESPVKIQSIDRLNRRVKVGKEFQFLPSRTLRIKFAGQALPNSVSLFKVKYKVYPFIPKTRICYSCFRAGHIGSQCKGSPRCLFCGKDKHDKDEECPHKDNPLKCINCGGNHRATSVDCPIILQHKQINALAATKNVSYIEARRKVKGNKLSDDPKFDFVNFPSTSTSNTMASFSIGSNNMPPLQNRFGLLSKDVATYSDHDCTENPIYANIAARPSHPRTPPPRGAITKSTSARNDFNRILSTILSSALRSAVLSQRQNVERRH